MQVKVWNDNIYDYTEEFRDQTIKIPAGKYILMEEGEAKLFKGSFNSPILDHDDMPDPRGYKKIRIERDGAIADLQEEAEVSKVYVCQADGSEFTSKEELDEYVKDNFAHLIVKDEEAERQMAAKARGARKKRKKSA